MGIRSHIDRYQPLNWRLRYRVMLFLVLALVLTPAAIFGASDTFSDVPDNNFAHAAINAIFGARITTGVSPGIYNPGGNVTREQMAAFLQRGLPRVARSSVNPSYITLSNSFQDIGVVTINTGGAPGGTGFVKVDASILAFTNNATGCPCEVAFNITQDGGGVTQNGYTTIYNDVGGVDGNGSGSLTWVFSVPTASTQTFRLRLIKTDGTATVLSDGAITALYVPFGGTGAGTLAAQSTEGQAILEAEDPKAQKTKSNQEQ